MPRLSIGLDLQNPSLQTLPMASETTLNAKNLAGLGADRLAELLLELAQGDAAAKRGLRMELASRNGGDVGRKFASGLRRLPNPDPSSTGARSGS
jgi:hypothetical protein